MDPLVSIVMSAYQAEAHLAASLQSVLQQTYRHREIIVVNDGSTDGTAAVLERFRQSHGIQVITQANGGQSAALNEGLRHAPAPISSFSIPTTSSPPTCSPSRLRP